VKPQGATSIEKLLSISSDPLAPCPAAPPTLLEAYSQGEELFRMLHQKNGFYAFETALHVFPISSVACMSLEEWNSDSLWREGYGDLARGLLFFAEDLFQDQFCLSAKGVLRFDSECGRTFPMADSIEQWALKVLLDYSQQTGWALANKWQAEHGSLPPGKRLMPKIPFFLGGAYSLDNLWAGDAVEGMRSKADLASQTKDLPEGSQVQLVVGRKPKLQ
jgi:hypothetical protein